MYNCLFSPNFGVYISLDRKIKFYKKKLKKMLAKNNFYTILGQKKVRILEDSEF